MHSDMSNYHQGNDYTTQRSQFPFYSNPYEELPPPPRPPQRGKPTMAVIVLLVIGFLVVSMVGWLGALPMLTRIGQVPTATVAPAPTPSPTQTLASPSVFITSPTAGSKVSLTTIVRGAAFNIPKGEELWVLMVVDGVKGYYPQSGPIEVENDSTWGLDVTVGTDKDHGRKFEIYTVLVDKNGRSAIDKYFVQTPSANYVGINPLPEGIKPMSRVDVIRG